MPRVLTTNAVIVCPHGGLGTSTAVTPWWKVMGGDVLQENDPGKLSCVFVLPCVGYTLRSMGLNASTVGGRRVILETDFQQSVTGMPLLVTEVHKVHDDSTPAPLPSGAPAPPLSPAMLDAVPPTASASETSFAMSQAGATPKVLSFAIASPFPNRWQLTWLDLVTGLHTDLTNGLPPNVAAAPSGGAWDEPSKTIAVTLSPLFFKSIAQTPVVGKNHRFVLTAISQRGLWGSAEVELTVTP